MLLVFAGCTTVGPDVAFDEVRQVVGPRLEQRIHWNRGSPEDAEVQVFVRELLEKEMLTADEAVQIGLLNNGRLQATYANLGVAQAELVQAGLLENPVFSAGAKFPLNDGGTEVTLGLAQPFLDLFLIPMRRRFAQADFDAARDRVSAAILNHAYGTRLAFLRAQAEQQKLGMRETMFETAALAHEFAERLHQAGNITDLHLATEQASKEQWRAAYIRAEERYLASREALNRWMGLHDQYLDWTIVDALPEPPEEELDLEALETRALEASLDLAAQRREIEAGAERLGLVDVTAVVPSLSVGIEAERDDGEWKLGPELAFALPVFDRGQARRQRTRSELGRSRNLYTALGAEIRSEARMAARIIEAARERTVLYRDVLLPLREKITNESLLHYNAMTLGPADLLLARRHHAEAEAEYVDSLYDYWAGRARMEQLLAGHLYSENAERSPGK